MFDTLLETHATKQDGAGGHSLSVVFHGLVIAAAVAATRRPPATPPAPPPAVETVDFVAPPVVAAPPRMTSTPTVAPTRLNISVLTAPINIPDVLPAIDLSRRVTDSDDYLGRNSGAPGHSSDRAPSNGLVATYYAAQVERPAATVPGSGVPEYPEALKAGGIEGSVRVLFVVDTTGRIDPGTVKVLASTHAQFTAAVRSALGRMRFFPAEIQGRPVRQLVELPFVFTLR